MGLDRKIQIKPKFVDNGNGKKVIKNAIFILKWGGLLTENGEKVASDLGASFNDL